MQQFEGKQLFSSDFFSEILHFYCNVCNSDAEIIKKMKI